MQTIDQANFTCPCCGYLTFHRKPGSYDICPICFWADDPVQLLDPWYWGGANSPPLVDAQLMYQKIGAMEERFLAHVRGVLPGDTKEPAWRLVEEKDKAFVQLSTKRGRGSELDLSLWYYWRYRPN